jgi:hypothetical protein
VLVWDEGGVEHHIELGSADPEGDPPPWTQTELLAIAEGLEPLGG